MERAKHAATECKHTRPLPHQIPFFTELLFTLVSLSLSLHSLTKSTKTRMISHTTHRSKTFASLLSPAAFTFGADFVADYEYAGIGAGWSNYAEGDYSLRTSINMMFLDALLYVLLAWYLDKVGILGHVGVLRHGVVLGYGADLEEVLRHGAWTW